MKLRFSLLFSLILGLSLTGCASVSRPPVHNPVLDNTAQPLVNNPYCREFPVGDFDQVVFHGDIIATVNGYRPKTTLRVAGATPTAYNAINVYTKNGVLYIQNGNGIGKPLSVELNLANHIHKLTVNGNAQVNLNNVGDDSMNIFVGGQSKTSISSNSLVVSKIVASGNATLHAYWVNSQNLQLITMDSAKVFLAGVVNNIDLYAKDDSDIDARYLRVTGGFIRATDDADVGINIKRAQSIWADKASTVYYYRDPTYGTHYVGGHGSGLRMVGIGN